MIKAVLFDLGGTLHRGTVPPGRGLWFAERITGRLADYGITLPVSPEELAEVLPVNAEEYKAVSEQTLREFPPAEIWSAYYFKGMGISEEVLEPIAEELSFLYDYERPMVMRRPGLKETMLELKGMGLKLGIISNIISRSVVPHFLAEYGIDDLMDCVVTSAATGIRKPSPEIFRIAEQKLGLGPDELCYVGDTISRDVRGTRNAGWKLMIRISEPNTAHRDKGLENAGYEPDCKISELTEIPKIIKKENAQQWRETK